MSYLFINRKIFKKRMESENNNLHIRLAEKYMIYKDLSERCLINPHHIDKGEKRVFYLKARTPFLEDPRTQNKFRNDFI
jgi:hypothetical protein